jgi:hypothetical protein
MRNDLGPCLAKEVHAADVVDMTLREQDVTNRSVIHGVEVAVVNRRLEAHPRVDDDAALRRRDQIRIGKPLG